MKNKNKKKYLLDEVRRQISATEDRIKRGLGLIDLINIRIKVEKKILETKGMEEEFRKEAKDSVLNFKEMLADEEGRIAEFQRELKKFEYRKQAILKLKEEDL